MIRHGVDGWELAEYDREWQPGVELLVYERGRVRQVVLGGIVSGARLLGSRYVDGREVAKAAGRAG